jgi:glutathione S-transferase
MASSLKLYNAKVCPFAQRTCILLAYKGIEHEQEIIDLTRDSEPWYLELNPEGTVPTIVHHGKVIYESAIVNEYLDEVFQEKRAFPEDPFKKAVSRILIDYCNHTFIPPFYELLMNQDRSQDTALKESVLETLRYLNARLMTWNPQGTFVWESFGMADIAFAPFFRRYCLNEHYRGFSIPNTPEYERVLRWRSGLLKNELVLATSMTDAEYIAAYADYARGNP